MPTHVVTRIAPDPKRPLENRIEVDGDLFAVLSDRDLTDLRLREGSALTPRELQVLKHREALTRARTEALAFLSRRARSRKEVLERLRGYGDELATEVVRDLAEGGVLDDRALAQRLCDGRLSGRPMGPDRLRSELVRRGIPRDVADDAIASAFSGRDEVELAVEVLRKIAGRHVGMSRREAAKKMGDVLRRRGFTWDAIGAAVSLVLGSEE